SDEDTIWEIGLIFNSRDVDGQANRLIPMADDLNPFNMAGYKLESSDTTYNSSEKTYGIRGKVIKELLNNSFLEAGLRMDFSQQKLNRSKSNSHLLLPAVKPTDLEENFEWASGFLGFTHPMSDTIAFTINSSFSAKPGGFSAYLDPGSALSEKFSKEKSWQNEIGLSLSPSETFGINVTGYWNEIDDYQFELPVPLSTDYYVANADEVLTKGIEIEAYFKPLEELTFSAAYGLTESEYEKFSALPALVGKQVSFVPDHTLSLSFSYEHDSGISGHLGTRTIGQTHYWNNTGTNNTDIQDTYTLLDASIGFERNGWGVNVFGTNLTDEEYYSSLVSSLTGSPGIVGSPRVIGLSLSKEF
nr:TonB-dependent receptor [Verrucomicrobiota bacterium]